MCADTGFRCGFVAIVGRPNVGKSTLMNHLIENKVSITSSKPQTTRHVIRGIYTDSITQFVFVDTPGFQSTSHMSLNRHATETLKGVDCALMVVEAMHLLDGDMAVVKQLPKTLPVILVINKVDKVNNKAKLADFADYCQMQFAFCAQQIISAKHHQALDDLKFIIRGQLPISPPLYDVQAITDKSERFLVGEIVVEKLFRYFGKEIPYVVSVEVERFVEVDALCHIYIVLLVNKISQKRMLIGKNGEKLKKVAVTARKDMEKLLIGRRVLLKMWVKLNSGDNHAKH
ncbi:MAG: GTPase Era [Neisseriales bacterium]|nr:MAG: GTPase Era [Neisseriales bacterium]